MRVNLIPMAGEGQRFKDAGYTKPKPLIDIDGLPMIVRAAQSLPEADRYIFVCRKQHLAESAIRPVLMKYFPGAIIVEVEQLTEGQAITCMLARDYIPDDAILTIGACDNDMVYKSSHLANLYNDPETDGWIWTFRKNPVVLKNPEMYGWVRVAEYDHAIGVSCKKTISSDPFNDHAVIGAFTFKTAITFFKAVEAMVMAEVRINNEYYVDVATDFAIKHNAGMKVFEVDQYICWGTPADYEEYNYWLAYFKRRIHA